MARRKLAPQGRLDKSETNQSMALLASVDSLEEIYGWLGIFRERLRLAREAERPEFEALLNRLEARYKQSRTKLA